MIVLKSTYRSVIRQKNKRGKPNAGYSRFSIETSIHFFCFKEIGRRSVLDRLLLLISNLRVAVDGLFEKPGKDFAA
jgi:hypothetical protein